MRARERDGLYLRENLAGPPIAASADARVSFWAVWVGRSGGIRWVRHRMRPGGAAASAMQYVQASVARPVPNRKVSSISIVRVRLHHPDVPVLASEPPPCSPCGRSIGACQCCRGSGHRDLESSGPSPAKGLLNSTKGVTVCSNFARLNLRPLTLRLAALGATVPVRSQSCRLVPNPRPIGRWEDSETGAALSVAV